jgi:Na+:H+ antiporter, NhaA family
MSKKTGRERAGLPLTPGTLGLVWRPFQKFAQLESASGLLLLLCTALALLWANSPYGGFYQHLLSLEMRLQIGAYALGKSLSHWINDGLMAVFFLLVGLEIKREMLAGELARMKQAALPLAAALGGMAVPALLYLACNAGGPAARGWGIPMATDIAFALGILSLLGRRVPLGLKVFLAALAIIDDIGAVLVIAFFYTAELHWPALLSGLGILAGLAIMNLAGVRRLWPYLAMGLLLWLAFLESGVHSTIAGVLLAFCIPHRAKLPETRFPETGARILEEFRTASYREETPLLNDERVAAIHALGRVSDDVEPALQRLERCLHPWVSFLILPLFALANAGVAIDAETLGGLAHPMGLGILAGLILGKPAGILLFTGLALAARVGELPAGANWKNLAGVGVLGGIGFTMSIFIAGLAIRNPVLLDQAKFAILCASLTAGTAGFLLLRCFGKLTPSP